MKNNIAAKFMKIEFREIQSSVMEEKLKGINGLVELLRPEYPSSRFIESESLSFEISANSQSSKREQEFQGVILIDAESHYGLKINKNAISLACFRYETYENMVNKFISLIEQCFEYLEIKHYVRLSLRNINLFKQVEDGVFEDVKNSQSWGSQNFSSLSEQGFSCSGAATRHEYISQDKAHHIQVASSVVFEGHSYIPHHEWDLWQLKGEIPTITGEPQLLIDIGNFQLILNNELTPFVIENMKSQITELRTTVNNVYNNIVGEA